MTQSDHRLSGGRLVVATALGAVCFAASLWLTHVIISGVAAGVETAFGARDLQSAVAAAKSGDMATAATAVMSARQSMGTAQALVSQPAFDALGVVPGVSSLKDDLVNAVNAGASVATAVGNGVDLLAAAKGANGKPPTFSNGAFDIAQLPAMAPPLKSMNESLAAAESDLSAIGSFPGFSQIKTAGLDKVVPLHELVAAADAAWPNLPNALGATGPKQYLVAILNPAELFPTGGAPLSVMMLRFDDGKLTIPVSGQVSTDIFPNPNNQATPISWRHIAGKPYYASPDAPSLFVNSNFHPDFTVSGEEMARAWQAGGKGSIDGVIAIDVTAIAAILDKTGPIALPNGSELTATNLGQRLLIDDYVTTQTPELVKQRHAVNNALMQQLTSRLQSVQSMPSIASGLLAVAPGRHFQVYMRDPALQTRSVELGLDGGLSPGTYDYFSVFTLSSPNKVAVFQQRVIDREVRLNADGSAAVTEKIQVRNTAPASTAPLTGRGYNDRRAENQYFVYVPDNSQRAELAITGGVGNSTPVPVKTYSDIGGRRFLWGLSAADPGQTALLTVTYGLPVGTFSDGSNSLTYRATVDPQPMWNTPTLTMRVVGPVGYVGDSDGGWSREGDSYTRSVPLDIKQTFVLSFRTD